MALGATIHRFEIELSDVDRSVYEALDLRVARHPSETMRYMLVRVLAYCLSFEEGIAFSKGGLSSADDPPIAVHDPTGLLLAWIDLGSPTAERLHRAAKAAPRVALFTTSDLQLLRRSAETIHKVDAIQVFTIDPALVDALEPKVERHTRLGVTRNEGVLYVSVGGAQHDGAVVESRLV